MTTVTLTPQEEERAARELHRRQQKAAKASQRAASREWRGRLRDAIRGTKRKHDHCTCSFAGVQNAQDLKALRGCCWPRWVCPRLDAVRRRMGL